MRKVPFNLFLQLTNFLCLIIVLHTFQNSLDSLCTTTNVINTKPYFVQKNSATTTRGRVHYKMKHNHIINGQAYGQVSKR